MVTTMKTRVFYFALAVVAAATAQSCVKEQLEQQEKPEIEITGQVFEANHEVLTKSTLVNLTPTWVEGDEIFVSGSNQDGVCTFAGENKFQTEDDVRLASPYFAIYPAAEGNTVNRETGIFTATVPSEQVMTEGQNVAPGALVAVAASETTDLAFKNAVGLVKVNIQREDVVSVKIESTASGQPVAGQFTMNLDPDSEQEGEAPSIAVVDGKGVSSVTLKPAGETFAAGSYYATVLPCNLSGIKVTFTRMNGEKSESVTVQKATATTIARNSGIDLGSFFVYEIGTAEELLKWNKSVAKWTAWDVVKLTDNIDCAGVITSENWTMNTFKGTFDGNGKTINNFVIEKADYAAFFVKLENAVVKNLTFGEGCSFTSTKENASSKRVYASSLASVISGTTSLTNVINKGKVTAAGATDTGTGGNYVAGICSSFTGTGTITGCENYGEVSMTATPYAWVNLGGLFGEITTTATLKECVNYGHVHFKAANAKDKTLNIGGITGGANKCNFDSCVNLGTVESNATTTRYGASNIGGIIGIVKGEANILGTIKDCVNGSADDATLGAVKNNAGTGQYVNIGGFVGHIEASSSNVTSFKNYGKVSNNGTIVTNSSANSHLSIGGVVGRVTGSAVVNSISNCENHGVVSNDKACQNVYIGGITGYLDAASTSFSNVSNTAALSNNGKAENTSDTSQTKNIAVGGVVGYVSGGAGNSITAASNTGAIMSGGGDSKATIDLGGIVGWINASEMTVGNDTANGVTNSGALTTSNKSIDAGLGGIVGHITGSTTNVIKNCKNTGNVTKSGWLDNATTTFGFGGILGYHTGKSTLTIASCTNTGKVEKTGGAVSNIHIGGIAGALMQSDATVNVSSCTNTGAVTHDSGSNTGGGKYCYTGGIVGIYKSAGEVSDCLNSGAVTNKLSTDGADRVRFGGIVGDAQNGKFTRCKNTGAIVDASTSPGGCVGGIAGRVSTRAVTMTDCDNEANITVKFGSESRSKDAVNRSTVCVGGIIGTMVSVEMTLTDCDHKGNITNDCPANAAKGKTAVGGLAGLCYKNTITNCHVSGDIVNNCTEAGNELWAGMVGQIEKNVVTKVTNVSVNANVTAKLATYSGFLVGRLTDQQTTKTTTFTNVWVKGSFMGADLTADNYAKNSFGTSSDCKPTTDVKLGDYVAPAN